jgi:hypothetical protein
LPKTLVAQSRIVCTVLLNSPLPLSGTISRRFDPARWQSYLTGWFPGTKARNTAELKIIACVLCSHRIFSGLHHNGFAIRDFSSLARLCHDGIIGISGEVAKDEILLLQYRIIRGEKISAVDLEDYCSPESLLFKTVKPFMYPLTRIVSLKDVTIAKERFVYQVELGDWSNQMESLGLRREPDRRQKMRPSPSK